MNPALHETLLALMIAFAAALFLWALLTQHRETMDSVGGAATQAPFFGALWKAVDPYVRRHKIASYEISHPKLLELAARSGKPLILSTGASTQEDIRWALDHFRKHGGRQPFNGNNAVSDAHNSANLFCFWFEIGSLDLFL